MPVKRNCMLIKCLNLTSNSCICYPVNQVTYVVFKAYDIDHLEHWLNMYQPVVDAGIRCVGIWLKVDYSMLLMEVHTAQDID